MSKDPRATRQASRYPVRGRLYHRLASLIRPAMWRISAERPPVREATVWLLSDCQHSLQPSSLGLVLSTTSSHHLLPLTFGRR